MREAERRDIQAAIDFLAYLHKVGPETIAGLANLPARIDYDAVVDMARQNGFALSARAIAEAFRLTVQARRVALAGSMQA